MSDKTNPEKSIFEIVEDPDTVAEVKAKLAKMKYFPKKDYSDRKAKAAALSKIKGHPLFTFTRENETLSSLIKEYKTAPNDDLFLSICGLSVHYARKGDLIYPLLKVKYGVSGPSDLMWTEDDEVRDQLAGLARMIEKKERDLDWDDKVKEVLGRIREIIFKEENILFPICAVNFSEEEWKGIYQDSKDYPMPFGLERDVWEEGEEDRDDAPALREEEIFMPGGHMTLEQLTALLNTIPAEITFVDADNMNRYFNEGPKVFKRPGMAIGRDVFSCHPPKIEPMVRKIIDDFRNNRLDQVPVWMEKMGRTMFVQYLAVRNKEGKYLGTVEIVQDMEFAKEHFMK